VESQAVADTHKLVVVLTALLGVLVALVAPGLVSQRSALRAKIVAENIIASLCAMIALSFVPRPIFSMQPHEQESPENSADVFLLLSTLLC
jgi:hypothetical protein